MATGTESPVRNRLRSSMKKKIVSRRASFTDLEMAFLHGLLIDNPKPAEGRAVQATETQEQLEQVATVLDDEMLFSIPDSLLEKEKVDESQTRQTRRPAITKKPRDYRFLVGLWQAHEEGVSPRKLSTMRSRASAASSLALDSEKVALLSESHEGMTSGETEEPEGDQESIRSDQEVRPDDVADDESDTSWGDEEGGHDHFDAWQVLKDEYASDFGFDYTPDGTFPLDGDTDLEHNVFKIIGTSAEDMSAHPHVLSPPLMDAIISFVPDHLQGQNMWMKYSLIRDGSSLETFKRYARASKETILAIETTKGQVFGCFTSSPWRTTYSFFGGTPSFVWKMRHNRNTPCHSLVEQAEMESEIDVFFLLGEGQLPQCCTSQKLGVGEGSISTYGKDGEIIHSAEESELVHGNKTYGFAIALEDDLLSGTSSKCSSFRNPCLVDSSSKGEPFEVLNLELWTFTPCFSLDSAEKLEMTQFFVSESIRNASIHSTSTNASQTSNAFSSKDLTQDEFYRRIGQNDKHEQMRERWQYRNMMDGDISKRGIGASPHFNNAGH